MKVIPASIPEVLVIEPAVYSDERGFFLESFNLEIARRIGQTEFVQDNHSQSVRNVVRGLHYQLTKPQGKLVRVVSGKVFDVAVDIRKGSASFGKSTTMELSAENRRVLWIPPGFAHGFMTTTAVADLMYKVTVPYDPKDERTILWNDPELNIPWPLRGALPVLSAKDACGKTLRDADLG